MRLLFVLTGLNIWPKWVLDGDADCSGIQGFLVRYRSQDRSNKWGDDLLSWVCYPILKKGEKKTLLVVDRKKGWDDYGLFRKGRIFISATVLYHSIEYTVQACVGTIQHQSQAPVTLTLISAPQVWLGDLANSKVRAHPAGIQPLFSTPVMWQGQRVLTRLHFP